MKTIRLIIAVSMGMIAHHATAQILKPVTWQFGTKKLADKEVIIFIKATIDDGWHLYSQHVGEGGPEPTKIVFNPSKDFVLQGKTAEPKAETVFEEVFKMNVPYFDSEVVFQQRLKLNNGNKDTAIKGTITYMVCNDTQCIPDEKDFTIVVN